MGVEPGADGTDVLVVGEDGKRPIELGKEVNLEQCRCEFDVLESRLRKDYLLAAQVD